MSAPNWILPCLLGVAPLGAVEFPGPAPGAARVRIAGGQLILENAVLRAVWRTGPDGLRFVELNNRIDGQKLSTGPAELFVLRLADGREMRSSELRPAGPPQIQPVPGRAGASRVAERAAGWKASVTLASAGGKSEAVWEATLRAGSHYVRTEIVLPQQAAFPVEIVPLSLTGTEASSSGEVDGSPLVAGSIFLGCEHPVAQNRGEGRDAQCSVRVFGPPQAGGSVRASAVLGVVPPGQMRRGFLCYLERERPRPYSPFVNYISWFDIAAPDLKMNEQQALEVIHAFAS